MKSLALLLGFCVAAAFGFVDTQSQLASQAEQHLRSGDAPGALILLKKASAAPATARGEDHIGFLYAVAGHPNDATTHFHKAIQQDAKCASAHYHLGVLFWLAKNQGQGLHELQTAAYLEPANFDYRYHLGSPYVDLGDYDKAIRELKAAIAKSATHAEAWQELGIAQQRSNDLVGAVASLAKAVELKPRDEELRNGYTDLLIAPGSPRAASKNVKRSLPTINQKGDKQGSAEAFGTGAALSVKKKLKWAALSNRACAAAVTCARRLTPRP